MTDAPARSHAATTPSSPPALTLCELGDPGIPGLESYSPFCLKAHRALRAAGLPYTRRHGAHPGAFASLNPAAQVPVLLVGAEPVADSTRILARLEALAARSLNPDPDPAVRAEALLWEELADTALNGFLVASRWADDRNWPAVRAAYFGDMPALLRAIVPGRLRARTLAALRARDVWRAGADACWSRFTHLLDQLDARLDGRDYWVGRALSVADVSVFAQLHSLRTPLTAWQRDELAARPRLSAYLDRIDRETRETYAPPASASAPAAATTRDAPATLSSAARTAAGSA